MHVFLEVRDSVDAAAEEAMRTVEEGTTPAEVRADPWFALRVAVHHDAEETEVEFPVPAKLSINVLAPLGSALYWLDGEIAGRRYVPVLPSRSELGGEVVPVRWAVARSKVKPGDVRVFDLGVSFPAWRTSLEVRANVGWSDWNGSAGHGEAFAEAVIQRRS